MQNPEVTYCPKEKILAATKQFETPFFLYKEDRIRENCRNFKNAFQQFFPSFEALYAIKANANPEVLKIVISEGFQLDASSEAEVLLASQLKMTGMYTGNYTPAKTLQYAKENGFLLNLDDISMIDFLPQIGVPETICFRINPGVGKSVEKSNVFAGPDAKYGIPFEKAHEAYSKARDLGVKHFGIHMMTGSNVPIGEKLYFAEIVEKLLEVVADIKQKTGIEIDFLNMGGGFGVPYLPDAESLNMPEIAKSVRLAFDKQCAKYNIKEPKLFAEPGRYITADAGWLIAKVTVIKDAYKKFLGLDVSSNDMPRPSIYDAYHHISVLNDSNEQEVVSVVGTICENNDQFAKDRLLPKAKIGDIVAIHNCGAHAYAMGHNYNGKLRSAEYLLHTGGTFQKIRRAETMDDLYATLKF